MYDSGTAGSSNGRTTGSGPVNLGSSPSPAASWDIVPEDQDGSRRSVSLLN